MTDSVRNCLFWLFPDMPLIEFHLTGNDIPNFDIMFLKLLLEFIDISYNNIETINPNVFLRLPSLTKADLSHNKLHKITSDRNTWLTLFKTNTRLILIDLSFNQLTSLHKDTFQSNINLRELYLQGNRFMQITFKMTHLTGFELLDLRNNFVQFLDGYSTRQSLLSLYENRQESNSTLANDTQLGILLTDNPLSCSCESLDFLQWFIRSPVFASSRHLYSCQTSDSEMRMTNAAVKEARTECDRPKQEKSVIFLSTLLPCIAILLLILVTINVYKRQKRKHLDQRFADRVRLLRENNIGFKYPVFLSYCSDDRDFVLLNILRPLRRRLRTNTNIHDRDLVCFADKHFIPGQTIIANMDTCLQDSLVFLAVVSRRFCASHYCKFEIKKARVMQKPILLIYMEHVEENQMDPVTREIFNNFTRIRCIYENGQHHIQPGWKQICEAIINLT